MFLVVVRGGRFHKTPRQPKSPYCLPRFFLFSLLPLCLLSSFCLFPYIQLTYIYRHLDSIPGAFLAIGLSGSYGLSDMLSVSVLFLS